jgi:hypothetical protein
MRSVGAKWRSSAAFLGAVLVLLVPTTGPASEFVPAPMVREWETKMVTTGRALCERLGRPGSVDQLLAEVYYDAERVFFQIAVYTGDRSWEACAQRAQVVYRDRYVIPNKGAVPGYWNFTRGLAMDYLRNGDRVSRDAVILLAENAAFAGDMTPPSYTVSADESREVAYTINSYLDAESVGVPRRRRLALLVDQALGHIDQWFVKFSWPGPWQKSPQMTSRLSPFMVGLTAEALIAYDERTHDARIPPAIRLAMDWLWANAWIPAAQAFWYEFPDQNQPCCRASDAAPDLDLLIAPAYAWLYWQSGDPIYRDRADQIFAGGVKGAWLGDGKHFDQNYRWSFDYMKWRTPHPAGR